MYLKSLSARGFKSFADRITLEFEPGISVIVGPNGSGKSNIADAVMWVLGEQSPRNLRGSRMEDVIFAGSATRQPQNMAEVSLALENGGSSSLPFPEMVITRRIYRTGESEYLLNNTPCRLVDIQELLSDLGVGRELTAVVGQNKLETILRSSPEERRAFIEEAAGLRKHRRRKEKALRKMEAVEQNLVRLRDIISEVNKQLRPLERQAQQAREYNELVSAIRDLSIRILVAELEELRSQWENRREEEERILRDLEAVSTELREGRERQALLEVELRELRARLDACREREMRLLSLGERLRSCENLGRERLKLYAALMGDRSAGEGWQRRAEEAARKRDELERELARADEENAGLDEEEGKLREEMAALQEDAAEARKERELLRQAIAEEEERLRLLKDRLSKEGSRREELEKESARLLEERGSLERLRDELNGKREEERRKLEEARSRKKELEERMGRIREDLARFEEELESVLRRQRRSFQDEALVVARLRALQEVFASHIDYSAAAARVLEAGEELPGVLGMLLHMVEVDPRWERAVESYLGPWLFCVVTRGLEDALAAVRMLKAGEEGYGIFLPLSEMEGGDLEEIAKMADKVGGVHALRVVKAPPEIAPALRFLLGDVVFCSSLEEAAGKAELYPKLTFVTEEGDVISPRKVVKGGARPRSPFHVIARRREIEQLQEMLGLCDEESVSLEVQRKSILSTLAGLRRELEDLAAEAHRMAGRAREAEAGLRALDSRREENEGRLRGLLERVQEIRSEGEELDRRMEALSLDLRAGRERLRDREGPLQDAQARLEELRRRQGELNASLQELKERRASLRERVFHLRQRLSELEEEPGPAPGEGHELEGLARAQEEMLKLVAGLQEEHGRLTERVRAREREWRGREEEAERELEGLRIRLQELEERETELRELAHNRDLLTAQLKTRVDLLVQRLLDEHRIPVETAVTEYRPEQPLEEMRSRLAGLERRREMLGQVNLRAVDEYQALKERHDFLCEQVEDLKESKTSLLKVVKAIDREIVRIFKETFEEVNRHFQELFDLLFPQGRAELVLSDPTDLLNTGVDIEAQPRGKRLKKLTLLSGGETALISLAFLFAIFKTRPSPFYFLDEVEAALDDVNLHRFLNMLKEFKQDSQLVVITHQKRTMEIADIIYGVSMQATGVSRVVSQRLEEAERLARTGTA